MVDVISMAEIIFTGSLLFLGEFRNRVAEMLRRGDAVDHDLRNLIVDDIKDIKSKIDSLARKDLLACINIFAEEFANTLHLLQRKRREDENYSAQRDLSTSTRLEAAYLKATEAFSNEALDISDRILAAKYRIRTTLLLRLDKPANAFTSCIAILKQLNDDTTIQKTFGGELSGGIKVWPGFGGNRRYRRAEIISSVCEVNRLVYDIMQLAVCDEGTQFYRWPGVNIGKEVIDPLRDLKVVEVLRKRGMTDFSVLWSFGQKGEGKLKCPQSIATNTRGDLLVADSGDPKIKIFDRKGNFLKIRSVLTDDDVENETIDLDTDGAGNIYLLVQAKASGMNKVYVLDKNENQQWNFPLKKTSKGRAVAVDRETGNVLVLEGEIGMKCNAVVEVYKNNGDVVSTFGERYLSDAADIAVARDGRIFVLDSSFSGDRKSISVFTRQGERLSEFEVVPSAVAVSFHEGDSSVVVASLLFHVESVKRRAKISLYSVSGNHWRTIDLDAKGVTLVESIAVTENGCIVVALTEDVSGVLENKVIVL